MKVKFEEKFTIFDQKNDNALGPELLDHLIEIVIIPLRKRPKRCARLKLKSAKLNILNNLWYTFFHKMCSTYNTLFSLTWLN